jgi:hypothetical protein
MADAILIIETPSEGFHDANPAEEPSQRYRNGLAKWELSLVDRDLNSGFSADADPEFRGSCDR